ncbi:MAG: response regulator transcription factor, partial [Anaerolineales bacterium]|nr:response regulator transcription factor [Anaerolineales bacterium]
RDLPEPEVLRVADITLDRGSHRVTRSDEPIDLTPTEFDLLGILMNTPGRVYSRTDLLEHTQGVSYEGYDRTIDVHIKNLRKKIEPDPGDPRYIETVYGIGYRFTTGTKFS